MRRGSFILAGALCVTLLCGPALANQPNPVEIPVTARYVRDMAWVEAPVTDGSATVDLGDGVTVTVDGVDQAEVYLVVYPIPREDAQAWAWLEECMEGYGAQLYPVELYFVDGDGHRVEVDTSFTVTIQGAQEYTNPGAFAVDTQGPVTDLGGTAQGNGVTFTATGSGYYVLAQRLKQEDVPQTGDTTLWLEWLTTLSLAGAGLVGLLAKKKAQK